MQFYRIASLALLLLCSCSTIQGRQTQNPTSAEPNAQSLSPELAPFDALIGSWEASGTGFRTVLKYRPGITGRAVNVENMLYGGDEQVIMTYEGAYTWDPDDQTIVFTTVSSTGERHTGKVTGQDLLWHMANVAGGSIEGYLSVIEPKGSDTFEYRAVYRADAVESEVLESTPLIYRRLPE